MTETPIAYTGTGTEADPITFDAMRTSAPDPAAFAVAGLAKTARAHATAFAEKADLSSALPSDLRDIVRNAESAITSTLTTAAQARVKADSFRNDVTLYPQGRELLAQEVIKAAADKVAESFAQADTQLDVAAALTYEAARPRITPDESMPARADLAMLTQRSTGDPAALADTLTRLSQRSDSVGALVADQRYLGDFLSAQGIEPDLRTSILTTVGNGVVQAAVTSGDPKRSAAARTYLALPELRKARLAAAAYTWHLLNG